MAPRLETSALPDLHIARSPARSLRRPSGPRRGVPEKIGPEEPTDMDGSRAGRLVVVSNRVPVPTKDGSGGAGGLTVALAGALKEHGGLWFGWSGRTVEREAGAPVPHREENVTYCVMDVPKRDFDHYYAGFANRALWPICHYRLDLLQIDSAATAGYFRVNRAFARGLSPLLRSDDLVWVHDYHFIPLGALLRELGHRNRIGFFLHIPWPPPDVASALPAYRELLEGLASYDVVGFHTPQDAENFARCLVRERVGRPLGAGFHEFQGRQIQIGVFPVGIDSAEFVRTAERSVRRPLVEGMRTSLKDKRLIIGVDRLDYSKGIRQRIEAFSCFLRSHPEFRKKVTLLQVTPKSRSEVPEYRKMQHEVAEQVGSTNGSLGDVDWTPIRYINKTVKHKTLAGLYRLASAGLVTPLRDGMNLVAKEFVAAQDPEDPGVLVLSRFAGAASEMDGALLVNPYDTETTASAIARALGMSLEERKERWSRMMEHLQANGVEKWCRDFVAALAGADAAAEPSWSGQIGRS
jgi:trehalose 6-phosphate synthase